MIYYLKFRFQFTVACSQEYIQCATQTVHILAPSLLLNDMCYHYSFFTILYYRLYYNYVKKGVKNSSVIWFDF